MNRNRLFVRSLETPPSERHLRAVLAAGTSLGLLLAPMTAAGQSAPPRPPEVAPAATTSAPPAADSAVARADALFREGFALLQARSFAPALAKFHESQRLDPAPGTMFNIATCEEGLGRFASAARAWREGFALLPADDTRRADAEKSAKEADGKAGRLVLRVGPLAPPGTTVSLAGRTLAANELGTLLATDPGTHAIVVSAPGYQVRELTATTVSGETKELVVAPGPALAAQPVTTTTGPVVLKTSPPAPGADSATSPDPGFFPKHPLSMGLLGTGLVLVGFGTGVSVDILSQYPGFVERCSGGNTCRPGEKEAMDNREIAVNTLFIAAGAAGLASAAVFFFVEGGFSGKTKKPGQQVSLAAGPGGLTFTLRR